MEETEDDGEDEYITLVQFVTDVIHKYLVVLVLSVYYSCALKKKYILHIKCIQNVPQCRSDHLLLGEIYLKHSNGRQKFSFLYISSISAH